MIDQFNIDPLEEFQAPMALNTLPEVQAPMAVPTPTDVSLPLEPTLAPGTAVEQPVAPNPLALQMQAFDKQKGAITGLEQASLGQNEATRQALNDVLMKPEDIRANNERIKKIQDEQIAKQKELEATTVKLKGLDEEYGKMGVNNEKFWEDRGTGSKILAGISIFLGGLGGGQNNALKIIDDAIDRDIASQKANIEKAGGRITQTKGLLGELRSQLGSMQSAENAYRAIASTNVQNQLSMAAAKSADPKVKAQADMAIGQLDQAKAKFLSDAVQTAQMQGIRDYFSPGATTREQMVSRLPVEDQNRYVEGPGYYGLIRGGTAYQDKIKTTAADAMSSLNTIDRLEQIDRTAPFKDIRAEAQTLKDILKGSLRTFLVGPGAVSESEWKILDSVIADPSEIFNATNKARLKTLKNAITRKAQAEAKVAGLKVDPTYNQVVSEKPVETKTGKK